MTLVADMHTRSRIYAARFFALLGMLLVGCVANQDPFSDLDPRQSATSGFVAALNTEASILLWVRADFSGESPKLIGSVARLVDGRWVGNKPIELGRGLSPKGLRSVQALNRQLSDTPTHDQTYEISLARAQDPCRGFLMPPNHLTELMPSERETLSFMITCLSLTKFGEEIRVTTASSDVLHFYHGRFQPDLTEPTR
jgi:hypothetical protein